MSQCIVGNGHMGSGTERPADICENITFRKLRFRAVKKYVAIQH